MSPHIGQCFTFFLSTNREKIVQKIAGISVVLAYLNKNMPTIGPVLLGTAALLLSFDTVKSKSSETGAHLFKIYCTKCHSTNGQAGVGPGLRHISKRMNQQQIGLVVRNGRNTMPPFGSKLSAAQIKELVDFLKNL